ncbi:MAG: hypothetical protein JEY99_04020 [Spirochaetales bacterium]|nr:hypothetical protein [Spirochaetales bacterium]
MKKKLLLLTIVLIFSIGTVTAASGDSMTIGGVVPLVLDLTLVQAGTADDLTLKTGVDTEDVVIATTTIATNSSAGWTLVVMSENGSNLINEETDSIAYTMSYATTSGGVSTTVATDALLLSTGTDIADSDARTGESTPEVANLTISYPRSLTYAAGYYSDLLTITLRAK